MVQVVENRGRIDLTFTQGEKGSFSVELMREDLDGNETIWDEDPRPTVLAQIRKDYHQNSEVLGTLNATVRTPTLDGVETLTIDFEYDFDTNPIPIPTQSDNGKAEITVGVWDYRLAIPSIDDVLYPGFGQVTVRRHVSRAP